MGKAVKNSLEIIIKQVRLEGSCINLEKEKSKTGMNARVLKQDANTWKVGKNSIYSDKTRHGHFQGKPFIKLQNNT